MAKLIMGQPLDSNLAQPFGSFLVVLVGVVSLFVALKLAEKTWVGGPILLPVLKVEMLRRISFLAAGAGLAANIVLSLVINEESVISTAAGFFSPLLHLALIAAVAAALVKSGGRRGLDIWVISLILSEVVFALVQNVRMPLVDAFLAYTVTMVVFRGRITVRQTVAFGVFALALTLLLTPVLLSVRSVRADLSWFERIEATVEASTDWRGALEDYQTMRRIQMQYGPYYLLYYGSPQNVLDRASLINHVDILKSGADKSGTVGLEDLSLAAERAVPRFLAPEKPRGYGHGDWLYNEVGVAYPRGGYATAPLIGTGYAAFGWMGALLYPLVLGFVVLILLKKIAGWNLYGNIWGIYLLLRTHNTFVEGSTDAYLVYIFRSIPQELVLLVAIGTLAGASFLSARRKAPAVTLDSR